MNELELTGRARTHIVDLERPRCALHYAAATSFPTGEMMPSPVTTTRRFVQLPAI